MFTYQLVYKQVLLLYCSLLPSKIKRFKLWFSTWLQIMLLSKVEYNHKFPGFEIKVETNIFPTNWVVSNFTTSIGIQWEPENCGMIVVHFFLTFKKCHLGFSNLLHILFLRMIPRHLKFATNQMLQALAQKKR